MNGAHDSSVQPLVSIITATYNAAETIENCLASVRTQDYPCVEHIIVDGASSDATMQIALQHGGDRLRYLSEPDRGIYDAWNKGLDLAKGEWIAFLGAADCYEPGAISAYMRCAAEHPEALYISSRVRWEKGNRLKLIGEPWGWPRFQRFMCTAHVGSMHRRGLFERYGRYDTSYRIVADYELLLRAGRNLPAAFLPEVTASMSGGGVSDSLAAVDETAHAKVLTGGKSRWLAEFERFMARQSFRTREFLDRHAGVRK